MTLLLRPPTDHHRPPQTTSESFLMFQSRAALPQASHQFSDHARSEGVLLMWTGSNRWVVPLPTAALKSVVLQLRGLEKWIKAINTRRSTRKVGPTVSVQHSRPLLSTEESTVSKRRGGKRPPLAAEHLCETELALANLEVTSTLPHGFPLHSFSHDLLLRAP